MRLRVILGTSTSQEGNANENVTYKYLNYLGHPTHSNCTMRPNYPGLTALVATAFSYKISPSCAHLLQECLVISRCHLQEINQIYNPSVQHAVVWVIENLFCDVFAVVAVAFVAVIWLLKYFDKRNRFRTRDYSIHRRVRFRSRHAVPPMTVADILRSGNITRTLASMLLSSFHEQQ